MTYAQVNGLNMYYEAHGTGRPLVLLHGGISNIAALPARRSARYDAHHARASRRVVAFRDRGVSPSAYAAKQLMGGSCMSTGASFFV